MSELDQWREAFEENGRWLLVGDVPPLSGEAALAAVELLWALADAIDSTYAAGIAQHRREHQRRFAAERSGQWPWRSAEPERQLRLDLGDEDDF